MKLKEVCEQTGLTQKTIRFYEEKQLISPTSTIKNGRSYREYSETDIKVLHEIAILRKALFSLEEIYLMQQDPEEIENIVANYSQRIITMASTLNSLAETVTKLNTSTLTDISELAQVMDSATKELPLPSYDANPKFKYIDEIEETEIEHQKGEKQHRQGESPFFLEQQQFTQRMGLFNEHYNHNTDLSGGSANFPKPQEPKVLRVVNLLISTVIIICTLTAFYFIQDRKVSRVILWNQIKGWMIPLDLVAITIRLLTSRFYQVISEYRDTKRLNRKRLLQYVGVLAGVLFIIGGGMLLSRSPVTEPEPDLSVVIANTETISSEDAEKLEQIIDSLVTDNNQDGTILAKINTINLTEADGQRQLKEHISSGNCSLYLFDLQSYNDVMQEIIRQSELELELLPADIQSNHTPAICDFSFRPNLHTNTSLEGITFYGMVLCDTSQEEYAIEILRKLVNLNEFS